jgi:hypothetical protein
MKKQTKRLLIIGPTIGCYGGMEAYMIALATAASEWPEYEVKLCFKLVKTDKPEEGLKRMAEDGKRQVYYIQRASAELVKLIAWADVLHVQNPPPDVVFIAKLMGKKVFLTVHNRHAPVFTLQNILWRASVRLAHRRWYNSNFVWGTWETKNKSLKSACIYTVCNLPQTWLPPAERKGFLFVGRWTPKKASKKF